MKIICEDNNLKAHTRERAYGATPAIMFISVLLSFSMRFMSTAWSVRNFKHNAEFKYMHEMDYRNSKHQTCIQDSGQKPIQAAGKLTIWSSVTFTTILASVWRYLIE